MLPRYTIVALGLLVLVSMGTATAGGGMDESLLKIDLTPAGNSVYYIARDASIWTEANGLEGLQSTNVLYKNRVLEPDAALLLA